MRRIVGGLLCALVAVAASAQWSNSIDDVPAFNSTAPTKSMPPILTGTQLTGPYFSHAYQVTVYKMAAKIPGVLWQQPCYCRCDREMGHTSLESCFSGTHGAACATCMKEGMYAYQQTKLGHTPAQIRMGIERGDWMKLDLDKAAL